MNPACVTWGGSNSCGEGCRLVYPSDFYHTLRNASSADRFLDLQLCVYCFPAELFVELGHAFGSEKHFIYYSERVAVRSIIAFGVGRHMKNTDIHEFR